MGWEVLDDSRRSTHFLSLVSEIAGLQMPKKESKIMCCASCFACFLTPAPNSTHFVSSSALFVSCFDVESCEFVVFGSRIKHIVCTGSTNFFFPVSF